MLSPRKRLVIAFGICSLASACAVAEIAQGQGLKASTPGCRSADSTAVDRVASRFHRILSTGDTAGIGSLLAPDLRILEGGTVENRQEYLAHHLSEDIDFARATRAERGPFSYRCDGNVAWVVSTSTSAGKFNGREINSAGAELMILSRTRNGWQIRAIHWSSARRQPR